jgi:hypothetical protein
MKKTIGHLVYTIEALGALVVYDIASRVGFAQARALVASCPVVRRRPGEEATARICAAEAEACVWYVKRVLCLQQSSVTTWMLRLHGVSAELVIGCRPVPVQSHAWVEVHGQVVNDRPQYQKFFRVLERF